MYDWQMIEFMVWLTVPEEQWYQREQLREDCMNVWQTNDWVHGMTESTWGAMISERTTERRLYECMIEFIVWLTVPEEQWYQREQLREDCMNVWQTNDWVHGMTESTWGAMISEITIERRLYECMIVFIVWLTVPEEQWYQRVALAAESQTELWT